jgi:predicted N-acetyltransferase YhbS
MSGAGTRIIPEIPSAHAEAIEALYDETFGPGHFAKTAERLREYNTSLPALSRVAIRAGKLIAATRIWPVRVETGGDALFVGPVAVSPEARGEKLGLQVTLAALQAAQKEGWRGAVLIQNTLVR